MQRCDQKKRKSKKNQNTFKYDCKRVSRRCGSYKMYLKGDSPHQTVMIVCECFLFSCNIIFVWWDTYAYLQKFHTQHAILCYYWYNVHLQRDLAI